MEFPQAMVTAEDVRRSMVLGSQRCVERYGHAAHRIPPRAACPYDGAVTVASGSSAMHVPSSPSDESPLETSLHPQVQLVHVVEAAKQCATASPREQAADRHREVVDG